MEFASTQPLLNDRNPACLSNFRTAARRSRGFIPPRRIAAAVLFVSLLSAPVFAAGFWTATEVEGRVVCIRRVGQRPEPVKVGMNLPPGAFVQVRAGSRAVFQSGEDREVIPAGQGRLLRQTDAPGYTAPPAPAREKDLSVNPSRLDPAGQASSNPRSTEAFYQRKLDALLEQAKAEARMAPPPSSPSPPSHASSPHPSFTPPYPSFPSSAHESRGAVTRSLPSVAPEPTPAGREGRGKDTLTAAEAARSRPERLDKPRLDPEEARAILRGERLAPSKIPIPSSTDAARSRGPTARLRALPPPEPGEASSEGFADGAGPATRDSRLQITWPPASAAVVSPPTMVRLAWTDGVTPQSLSLQSEGVELFAVPLAESDREVPLPEFGVMVRAGGAYSLSVEWTDPVGTRKRTAIRFRLLSEAERDRMRQDLYYLYEALGPRWNGRQGLMLRASAFAEYNCQGEAAALLLRYTALAPDDKEVYALLHHFFRALQQPDRADAALALASP